MVRARNILADIKVTKGRQLSNHGRMQEVLLQAINKAQSIIETRLNGVSFCQEYVALGHLIQTIESNKEGVETLQREVTMVTAVNPFSKGNKIASTSTPLHKIAVNVWKVVLSYTVTLEIKFFCYPAVLSLVHRKVYM